MERYVKNHAVAICCLVALLSVSGAAAQESGGLDVRKTPDGMHEGRAVPEATAPFPSLAESAFEDLTTPPIERRDDRLPAVSSLQITPKWSYFNLPDGTSLNGGDVQADLHLAITDAWITHVGADESSIAGGELAGYTWDLGKLADLDASGLWGRSAAGVAVDFVHLEKLFPDQIFLSQLRGVWGYALSDVADVGIVGIWPTVGDNYLPSTITTGPTSASPLLRNVSLTRQVHGYLARSFGNLETVWTLGYRDAPHAMLYAVDAAYPLRNNATLVSGLAANDLGGLNFYLGLQLGVGVNRFTPSRMRGYFHRINRGGLFSTLTPSAALRATNR